MTHSPSCSGSTRHCLTLIDCVLTTLHSRSFNVIITYKKNCTGQTQDNLLTSFRHCTVCAQLKILVLLKLILNNLTSLTMLNCLRWVKLHQDLSTQLSPVTQDNLLTGRATISAAAASTEQIEKWSLIRDSGLSPCKIFSHNDKLTVWSCWSQNSLFQDWRVEIRWMNWTISELNSNNSV